MEKSIILMFIKFFNECTISKRIKRTERFINILSFILIVFSWPVINIIYKQFGNTLSNITIVYVSLFYSLFLLLIIHFQCTLIVKLFPNEYFLMKLIKCYLGKIFRDIYLSDVDDYKVARHILTLSHYIACLFDIQRIKSQNIISNKTSLLTCKEFLYFINNKLDFNEFYIYKIHDLTPEQIPDIVFGIINDEYETSKNMKSDSKINIELNAFLNSKFGKKFINETVIYYFSDFDDYEHGERWLYNKRHLVVIEHNLHYRRYIKTDNKEVYDKKHEKLTDSKKNKEKTQLSWIDDI